VVNGAPYVIDDEGIVMAGAAPEGAPHITAVSSVSPPDIGDRVDRDAVRLTQELLAQVPGLLALNIAAIEWSNASGLTVHTDAGYRVVIGDSENVEYKLAVWGRVEAELGREAMNGHVLDLRFGDRPSLQ
jgi:cell division septal protein FtsQ